MQSVLILQHFGLGDVIFSMTAIKKSYSDKKIIWPVLSGYVEGLQKAYPDIEFVGSNGYDKELQQKEFASIDGKLLCPLRWSYELLQVPFWQCMMSKYMLFEQDWKTWKEQAMWKRSEERERELFNLLGLTEGEKYNLVNRTFGCDFKGNAKILLQPTIRTIDMKVIPGFSLFDWAGVIEQASTIHTVSTSIIYLLEMLQLKADYIHIYIRRPNESNHKNYDYILTSHNYILHP